VGGAGGVWSAVAGHDSEETVVIRTGVVVAEGPVEFSVGLGGGVDAALLGGTFSRWSVVGFALFAFAVHPVKLCVGSLFLVASFCRIDVRPRRQEVGLLEIPVGFFE
jgi:hypothetical protein